MPLRAQWKLGTFDVCLRADLDGESEFVIPMPRIGADLLIGPFARRAVSDLLRAIGSAGVTLDLTRPDGAQKAIRILQRGFDSGDLVAFKRKAPAGTVASGSEGQSNNSSNQDANSGGAGGSASSNSSSEKTWVDVQLVDDLGDPVPGARYKLKITDGSLREGSLDGSGRARVNGIDPGECTVWFPDFDGSEWKKIA